MTFLDFLSRDPSRFDAMLLDLDGTLLLGDEPLPGAAELIALLRRNRTPFFFLTNNCSNTSGEIAARLNAAGIEAYPEDIAGAAAPLREELARKGWEKLRFFLIGSATFPEQLGLQYATDPKRIGECDGILFLGGLHDWRTSFHAVLNELMKRPELPVVIPNPDRLNPVKGGVTLCPLGQFELVRFHLRELGIEIRPLHMGKPCPAVYEHVLARFPAGTRRERVAGVGDFLGSDIEGANRAGLQSAVVLTGLTDRKTAETAEGFRRPGFIFDSIG